MTIESDMTLLRLAARVDPTLRDAAERVDEGLRELVAALDKLTNPQHPNDLVHGVTDARALLARVRGESTGGEG